MYKYMYVHVVWAQYQCIYMIVPMCFLPQQNVSSPHTISATNFIDYTARIQNIWDTVLEHNYSTIDECCDYKYQLLDKFCASRNTVSWARCLLIYLKTVITTCMLLWMYFFRKTLRIPVKTTGRNVETVWGIHTMYMYIVYIHLHSYVYRYLVHISGQNIPIHILCTVIF